MLRIRRTDVFRMWKAYYGHKQNNYDECGNDNRTETHWKMDAARRTNVNSMETVMWTITTATTKKNDH